MAIENDILKEYLSVSHEVGRLFRSHYGKINLTFPQAMALSLLETEGSMPISSLAEQMGSANSTISGVIDRLERMNFVRRVRSDMDRRVIYVELTEYWTKVRSDTMTDVMGFFGTVLNRLEQSDQDTMLEGLRLLNKALKDFSEE